MMCGGGGTALKCLVFLPVFENIFYRNKDANAGILQDCESLQHRQLWETGMFGLMGRLVSNA